MNVFPSALFFAAVAAVAVFGLIMARLHRYTERSMRNYLSIAAVAFLTTAAWLIGSDIYPQQALLFAFFGLISFILSVSQPVKKAK